MSRKPPVIDLSALGEIDADIAVKLLGGISLVKFHRVVRDGWIEPVGRNRYGTGGVITGYLKFLEHQRTHGKTANEAAHHVDMSQRRLFQLIDEGVIPRPADPAAGFDLDTVRLAVLRHQRKLAAGHGVDGDKLSLSGERAQLAKAQRARVERENAVADGRYAPVEQVVQVIEAEFSTVREGFLSLPGSRAYEVAITARQAPSNEIAAALVADRLRDAVHEILTNLSSPAEITTRAAAREKPRRGDAGSVKQPAAEPPDGGGNA